MRGSNGEASGQTTIGLLRRRHIRIEEIEYIGKESNLLEEVLAGSVHDSNSVYTRYPDIRRDEWVTRVIPALKKLPLQFLVKSCNKKIKRRAIIDVRANRSRPHLRNQILLISILKNSSLL
jgi:hypothetical protein